MDLKLSNYALNLGKTLFQYKFEVFKTNFNIDNIETQAKHSFKSVKSYEATLVIFLKITKFCFLIL